jgi:hypothetical protein
MSVQSSAQPSSMQEGSNEQILQVCLDKFFLGVFSRFYHWQLLRFIWNYGW